MGKEKKEKGIMNHPDNDHQYIITLEGENKRLRGKLKRWESLIKKIEKVIEHGWGGIIVKVKEGKVRTRTYLDDDWEDVKVGGTDAD